MLVSRRDGLIMDERERDCDKFETIVCRVVSRLLAV